MLFSLMDRYNNYRKIKLFPELILITSIVILLYAFPKFFKEILLYTQGIEAAGVVQDDIYLPDITYPNKDEYRPILFKDVSGVFRLSILECNTKYSLDLRSYSWPRICGIEQRGSVKFVRDLHKGVNVNILYLNKHPDMIILDSKEGHSNVRYFVLIGLFLFLPSALRFYFKWFVQIK